MRILIVNDDSISAPGIAYLARAASRFAEVWVVAPAQQCSAMSQKLTLRDPLTLEKVEDFPVAVHAAYKVGGTPVDCVKVALEHIMDEKPDYVFSGINNGYNAGYDIAYSGTLGAAFEAARNGIPAMAFSVAHESWLERGEEYFEPIIRNLLDQQPEAGFVWNVNFPAMREGAPRGILWDRTVAPTSMYREQYVQTQLDDGRKVLYCKGIPVPDEAFPESSDAYAVRNGYISIGKLSAAL